MPRCDSAEYSSGASHGPSKSAPFSSIAATMPSRVRSSPAAWMALTSV